MFDFIPEEILGYIRISFGYIFDLMPLWLPAIFLKLGFDAWIYYRRADYWNNKLGSLVLEIKLPPNVDKSPLAMELVLNQLHQTADEGNWYWKYWRGQTRSWFSLEIASFGGEIHFYIWARKKYQNGIEAHLYSQYPGIEVYEIKDYTIDYHFNPARQKMFACQWKLDEADPLPISTYVKVLPSIRRLPLARIAPPPCPPVPPVSLALLPEKKLLTTFVRALPSAQIAPPSPEIVELSIK